MADVAPKISRRLRLLSDKVMQRHTSLCDLVPNPDPDRLLAMTSVHDGGLPFLNVSLPAFMEQVRETGLGVDLLIGLNNDAASPQIVDQLRAQGAQIIELWTDQKRAAGDRARIYDHPQRQGAEYRIPAEPPDNSTRIFLVHQAKSEWSAGKAPMMLDLVSLCVLSIEAGWKPGRYLYQFDADTLLFRTPWHRELRPDPDSNGLAILLQAMETNSRLAIVCPICRHMPYQQTGEGAAPDFSQKIYPIQSLANWIHGRPGADWNVGINLSRTLFMLALSFESYAAVPGTRSEDFLQGTITPACSMDVLVETTCTATNACPGADEKAACEDQFVRWIAGSLDVMHYFRSAPEHRKLSHRLGLLGALLLRPITLVAGGRAIIRLQEDIGKHRRDLISGEANW